MNTERSNQSTPVQRLGEWRGNCLFVKREDLIPVSFGGNKARKAVLFFEKLDEQGADCVVTYGSSSSNHCRVVANLAAARGIGCYIISPEEASRPTFNSQMMELFGAEITICPVSRVAETIEYKLQQLQKEGHRPYFIAGGGHGNIGTQAYVNCYQEIVDYEQENDVHFDYIFHASGTGTTQAGLICGQLLHNDRRKIVGISIARKKPRGEDVVRQSVRDYLADIGAVFAEDQLCSAMEFEDRYTGDGYGSHSDRVRQIIQAVLIRYGMPLDGTYTGKAFAGMDDYVEVNSIKDKNILFIHTGGTPLFFDDLMSETEGI